MLDWLVSLAEVYVVSERGVIEHWRVRARYFLPNSSTFRRGTETPPFRAHYTLKIPTRTRTSYPVHRSVVALGIDDCGYVCEETDGWLVGKAFRPSRAQLSAKKPLAHASGLSTERGRIVAICLTYWLRVPSLPWHSLES